MVGNIVYYERLIETADMIARHVDYPGKARVVDQCRQEIVDLAEAGRITEHQGENLLCILQGLTPAPSR